MASLFLAHASPGQDLRVDLLETELTGILASARASWPEVQLSDQAFLQHLASHVSAEGDVVGAVAAIHGSDLFLACACVHGDVQALAAFEARFMSQVSAYLSRRHAEARFTDELKQALRTRLLVADGDTAPRIGSYTGRGPLGAWLRSVTVRAAIDMQRQHDPGDPGARGDLTFNAAAPDPELTYIRTKYAAEFREAFEKTLEALSAREGNVLRLYFLEGMTTADIGLLYKVSGRTVQRWVAETRQKILARTHRHLRDKLKLSNTEFGVLLSMVESQVDVSILRHLGGDPNEGGG